jgi:hypothetical protein
VSVGEVSKEVDVEVEVIDAEEVLLPGAVTLKRSERLPESPNTTSKVDEPSCQGTSNRKHR